MSRSLPLAASIDAALALTPSACSLFVTADCGLGADEHVVG